MSLFKHSSALLIRQVVSALCNLIGISIASIYLMPADFAYFAILVPLMALATLFADLGNVANTTTIPKLQEKSKINSLYLIRLLFFIFIYIVIIIIIKKFKILIDDQALLFLLFIPIMRMSRGQVEAIFQRELKWIFIAKVQTVEVVIYNFIF